MSDENSSPDAVFRDGTSQAARRPVALDPSYVSVDERSIQDFLAFSASYAKTLNYYDLENHPAGDWSGFLDLDPRSKRPSTSSPPSSRRRISSPPRRMTGIAAPTSRCS